MKPFAEQLSRSEKTLKLRPFAGTRGRGGCAWVNHAVAQRCGLPGSPEGLRQALDELHQTLLTDQATVLKQDRRTVVRQLTWRGRTWVVKQYHQPRWKQALYHPLGQTPAWREWRGAARLARAGVRCNPPLALMHTPPSSTGQWLVMPYVVGATLAAYLQDPALQRQGPTPATLARAIGGQIGEIVKAGLINRDHKPTNLIIDEACAKHGCPPVIIDPVGVQPRRHEDQIYRMLAVLFRSSIRVGDVSGTNQMRCVKAMIQSAHGKCGDQEIRHVIGRTLRFHFARPLSYEPTAEQRKRQPRR